MEVIQIPLNDLIKPIPNIRTRTFFIVNDRLDTEVLRKALDDLIRNHWRKLAARVVRGAKNGQLEYHLPKAFADDYVLFKWSSEDTDRPIDKVVSSLKRPVATDGIAFLPPMRDVDSHFRPADWPFEQKDDPPNSPNLYVHVRTFTDSTVITISWLHVFGDQLGLANMVKAWLGVVEGKEPPPLVGHDEQVLPHAKEVSDYPEEKQRRKGRMRVKRPFENFFVILGFIPEFVFQPKEDDYTVFFPLSIIESLRERWSKELTKKYGADPGLSDADIITAILTKFSRMYDKSPRTISLSQTVNLRGRIPQLQAPTRDGFLHNALIYATARFRYDHSMPLGEIAYLNRKAVKESLEPDDIELGLAIAREMVRRGQVMHTCEPFEKSYSVTNWCGAWKGVDFGAAATKDSVAEGKESRNVEMLILGQSGELKTPHRFHSTVMCKADGGYWVDFSTSVQGMNAVREYVKKDPELTNL